MAGVAHRGKPDPAVDPIGCWIGKIRIENTGCESLSKKALAQGGNAGRSVAFPALAGWREDAADRRGTPSGANMNGHRHRPPDVPEEDRALIDVAADKAFDIWYGIFRDRFVVELAHPTGDGRVIAVFSGLVGCRTGMPE